MRKRLRNLAFQQMIQGTVWLWTALALLFSLAGCSTSSSRGPSGKVSPLTQSFSTWTNELEKQNLKIAVGRPLYMFKGREKCMRCSGYDMENLRSQSVQVCLAIRDALAPGESPDAFHEIEGTLNLVGVEKTARAVSPIKRFTPVFEASVSGHKIFMHYAITATDEPLTYKEFFQANDNDRLGDGEKYFGPARLARCLIQFGDAFRFVQSDPETVNREDFSKEPYSVWENEESLKSIEPQKVPDSQR